jgi:transcriptional regulator with XRE-family HTH domain/tetratricopeptide (TPR) repeat protein
MPRTAPPDLSIVLTFLRLGQGWSQADLGEAAGVSPNLLNDYERGRKTLTRERLEYLIAFMGLPAETIDDTLTCLESNRAASRPPGESAGRFVRSRRGVQSLANRFGKMAQDFVHSSFTLLTVEGEALHARQRAEFLWDRLKRHSPVERRVLVEDTARYRGWALCEKVAAESVAAAPNHPRQALELAELALLIADRIPGEASWRSRLQGYAWAHISNARRVCNDLLGAEEALARAWKLWGTGAPGDPGLLNEAWLPWMEAALRRDQRRFPEALKRIEEALAFDLGELRGQILLSKARIFETLGDPEGSTTALIEATPLIDAAQDPRLAFGLRFNLLVDLCHLDRAAEAALKLPEVRALGERLGQELDLMRVRWLEGKVSTGLGQNEQARLAFEQVRRTFKVRELAFDYALVSLELAVLLLEKGSTVEVHSIAQEMLWIFKAQGVHREALVALRLFCDAATQDAATIDLTHRVIKYLYRAQHDPELRFLAEEEAEAQ